MSLSQRLEKAYLLQLLREGNIALNEIRGQFVLPSEFNRKHKPMLMKKVVSSPKQDKSALAKV
jgi:hypothetical protein